MRYLSPGPSAAQQSSPGDDDGDAVGWDPAVLVPAAVGPPGAVIVLARVFLLDRLIHSSAVAWGRRHDGHRVVLDLAVAFVTALP